MLPICQKAEVGFLDAFFISTSAVCVTGLATVDTATAWTIWGQATILILIQLGGLGIMTIATVIFISAGRKISAGERLYFHESIATGKFKDLVYLIKRIMILIFAIEFIGAISLTIGFMSKNDAISSIWAGLFHSISAFNNAGFSLFSSNLMEYGANEIVSITIMGLIILGGLGYFVMIELMNYRPGIPSKRLSIHSRSVLWVTACLIISGALIIYFAGNITLLDSLFQSVTARTAGFNTVDLATLPNVSILVIIVLMFIGASPGSTGGGIKTTSFLMILSLGISRLKGHSRVSIFKRTIPTGDIIKSVAVFTLGILVVTAISSSLIIFQSGLPSTDPSVYRDAIFETVSAFGTVGLSLGFTPHLTDLSKIAIIIAMLIGKVGILTVAYSLAAPKGRSEIIYAKENIMVG